MAAFDGGATEAGRDPLRLAAGFLHNAWVSAGGETPDHVWEGAWHQLGTYIAWEGTDTPGSPYRLPPVDPELVRTRTAMGDPDQVVATIRPRVEEFGHRRLTAVFRLHYPGMTYEQAAPAVELFGKEVIPALRACASG